MKMAPIKRLLISALYKFYYSGFVNTPNSAYFTPKLFR